ncbi:hypothetical protein HAX54_020419 [Datura stramonium]|uniref:K Homology domain-containing protein n=1 Tax=Datura stramonium TaxID=4076 RepID=A0ABS8UR73_DATST|nr:hypothetical protein [Datura stramonium]
MNMESRIPPGSYFQYSPTGIHGPLQRSSSLTDRERYLADLLGERQKLGPFLQILPICSRLLSQEIMRATALLSNQFVDQERMGQESPHRSVSQHMNGGQINMGAWSAMQTEEHFQVVSLPHPVSLPQARTAPGEAVSSELVKLLGPPPTTGVGFEENRLLQKMAPFQPSPLDWHVVQGTAATPVVKRVIRLDVPVENFPNYNFVGRILGPRGNSLKRVEAITECRVYIRGQGSVKDSIKEEKLKDKPGYEHLKEPLHLLVEAEFPEDIIDSRIDHAVAILENLLKPVDESVDVYKKQQLRELAMLNGTLREESPSMSPRMSPSMSPFSNTGMKRAKTGR